MPYKILTKLFNCKFLMIMLPGVDIDLTTFKKLSNLVLYKY